MNAGRNEMNVVRQKGRGKRTQKGTKEGRGHRWKAGKKQGWVGHHSFRDSGPRFSRGDWSQKCAELQSFQFMEQVGRPGSLLTIDSHFGLSVVIWLMSLRLVSIATKDGMGVIHESCAFSEALM